jgi:hypothetical protein
LGASHLKSKFQEEVSIEEKSFSDFWTTKHSSDIKNAFLKYFPDCNYTFYSITRLGKGLVHPAITLEIICEDNEINYFVIRYFEKNEEQYRTSEFFDRAVFHSQRMRNLKLLGKYYPDIRFYDLPDGVLILQEFFFFPICEFTDQASLEQLVGLLFTASKHNIFLDFNHNHWLYDKEKGKLFYVDKDYNEDLDNFESSVSQNFNQAAIFLNEENYSKFALAVKSYNNVKDREKKHFFDLIVNQLHEKIVFLSSRENTPVIKKRLDIYKEMIASFKE